MILLCSLAKGQSIEGHIIKVDGDNVYINLHRPNIKVSDVLSVINNGNTIARIEITAIPGAYSVGKVLGDVSAPLVEKMVVRKDDNSAAVNSNTTAPAKAEIVPQQQENYSPPANQKASEPVNREGTTVRQENHSQPNSYAQAQPYARTNDNTPANNDEGVIKGQISIEISPGIQYPLGTFGKEAGLGFGGSVSGEYLIVPNVGVGINIGYNSFSQKDHLGIKFSSLPITLNGKYYFATDKFRPYIGVDVGVFIMGQSISYGSPAGIDSESGSSSVVDLGLAPILGFKYNLSGNLALDVNLKFTHTFDQGLPTSTVGLNVGIVYFLGK